MESAGIVPAGNIGIEKIVIAILVVMLEYTLCGTLYSVCFSVLIAFLFVYILE